MSVLSDRCLGQRGPRLWDEDSRDDLPFIFLLETYDVRLFYSGVFE